MSLNGTKCEQIQRDIRTVNTPQNRMKMDFDLSSLPGAISQQIASQYQSDIQAYREANNNYLAVCKNDRYAAQANADLNELFKLSVAKADANYEKMKAESDKAMAEANKAKAEADKAKAEADSRRAQAEIRQAEARKKEAEAEKSRVTSSNNLDTNDQLASVAVETCKRYSNNTTSEFNLCVTSLTCGFALRRDAPVASDSQLEYACSECCQLIYKNSGNRYNTSCPIRCIRAYKAN